MKFAVDSGIKEDKSLSPAAPERRSDQQVGQQGQTNAMSAAPAEQTPFLASSTMVNPGMAQYGRGRGVMDGQEGVPPQVAGQHDTQQIAWADVGEAQARFAHINNMLQGAPQYGMMSMMGPSPMQQTGQYMQQQPMQPMDPTVGLHSAPMEEPRYADIRQVQPGVQMQRQAQPPAPVRSTEPVEQSQSMAPISQEPAEAPKANAQAELAQPPRQNSGEPAQEPYGMTISTNPVKQEDIPTLPQPRIDPFSSDPLQRQSASSSGQNRMPEVQRDQKSLGRSMMHEKGDVVEGRPHVHPTITMGGPTMGHPVMQGHEISPDPKMENYELLFPNSHMLSGNTAPYARLQPPQNPAYQSAMAYGGHQQMVPISQGQAAQMMGMSQLQPQQMGQMMVPGVQQMGMTLEQQQAFQMQAAGQGNAVKMEMEMRKNMDPNSQGGDALRLLGQLASSTLAKKMSPSPDAKGGWDVPPIQPAWDKPMPVGRGYQHVDSQVPLWTMFCQTDQMRDQMMAQQAMKPPMGQVQMGVGRQMGLPYAQTDLDPTKPFVCDICFRRFKHKSSLRAHRMTHTNQRPFQCSMCPKRFIQKSNLTRHERSHRQEKRFQCAECGKRFTRKSGLQKHERIHNGDRPFPCDTCGKRFTRKDHLKLHVMSHSRVKLFKCTFCGKRYRRKAYLKQHLYSHSEIIKNMAESNLMLQ